MPYKSAKDRSASRKRWLEKHPGKLAAYQRKWKEADPRRSMLISAKDRAKRFSLPINITLADIIIPEYCPVFPHIVLERCKDFGRDNSPTLDRIKPALGYVKGNIKVISFKANRLKSDATAEELLAIAAYVKGYS